MYKPNFRRDPQNDMLWTIPSSYAYEMTDYPRDGRYLGTDALPVFWATDDENAQRKANEYAEIWNAKELSWMGAFGLAGGVVAFLTVLYGLGII
jgi:hypothetical protein